MYMAETRKKREAAASHGRVLPPLFLSDSEHLPQKRGQQGGGMQDHDLHVRYLPFYVRVHRQYMPSFGKGLNFWGDCGIIGSNIREEARYV